MNKRKFVGVFIISMVLMITGCSMTQMYGKYAYSPPWSQRVTIGDLYKNWQNYHVYYAGVQVSRVNAILFDPKNDDRKLEVHEWWEEVKDPEVISDLMGFIYMNPVYYPSLRVIKDPKDHTYGYLYSVWWTIPIKVIDDKTMWVDDLSTNPFQLVGREN